MSHLAMQEFFQKILAKTWDGRLLNFDHAANFAFGVKCHH